MAKKKSKRRNIIIISVFAVIFIVIVGSFLANKKPSAVMVTTEPVTKRTITQTVSAIGKIQPETEIKISPETSGEIVLLDVKEGDTVKAGRLLVRIKPDIVESQLEQTKFAAEAVKSEISAREAEYEKAQADFRRAEELYKKKYISQEEFDRTKALLESSLSSVNSNKLRYDQAKASYRQTERTAARTMIYAPINGVVTKLDVEKGEKVVGTEMMQGTEMMRISDLNVMNAEVEVDENDITLVKIGDTANVEIDAFPDRKFKGVVIEIGHSALVSSLGTQDQVTNFKVKIRLVETDAKLRPGMSCNAEIKTETRENVLSVPLQSVTEKPKEDTPEMKPEEKKPEKEEVKKTEKPPVYVFVVKGTKVSLKEVKTGLSDKGYIEITNGLNENEVIVSGSYFAIKKELKDSSEIRIDNKKDNQKEK